MKKIINSFISIFIFGFTYGQSSEQFVLKGDSLFDDKNYSLAIENYSKAIELDTLNAEAYFKRGNIYAKKHKDKKALSDYNLAILLNPNFGEAYIKRSEIKYKLGNFEGGLNDRQKAEVFEVPNSNDKSYTASNGITYHVGDTIKLGLGSNPNGEFRFLQISGWGGILMSSQGGEKRGDYNIGKGYAYSNIIIKKIKFYKVKGAQKVYFTVGGGNITNYSLAIEEAIATCEIDQCHKKSETQFSIADELLKMQKLLNDGLITKEEFEAFKKKLLAK